MAESTEWAQERLGQANLIFEPHEKPWPAQFINFLVWVLECALIWLLAGWLLP
jgi:hypothetical protein